MTLSNYSYKLIRFLIMINKKNILNIKPVSSFFNSTKLQLLFFVFLFIGIKSQSNRSAFDSILLHTPTKMLDKNVPREEIIKWNEKMLKKAEKENYKNGIILSYINIAFQYHNLGKPDISIKYLNKAKAVAELTTVNDDILSRLYLEFSKTYYTMGLHEISLKFNSKAMFYARNTKSKNYLSYIYLVRSLNLSDVQKDSALFYLYKAKSISKITSNFNSLAYHYISHNQHLDSAKIYLNKSSKIYNQTKDVNKYELSIFNYYYGRLYINEKQYSKAVYYLEKALLYCSYGKNRQHLMNVYDALAFSYRKTGNLQKEKQILDEYKKFNDLYLLSYSNGVEETLKNNDEEKEKLKKNYFYYSSISLIIIIMSFFLFFEIKKRKSIIPEKDDYTKNLRINSTELEKKSIQNLDELYKSAVSRDPNFYNKFQHVFPNFIKNLLAINPELKNSEMLLLAYVYLKFETKEIANLLFLSPKTIQNRKHNIRKKLNIKSSENIYQWIKSLNQ